MTPAERPTSISITEDTLAESFGEWLTSSDVARLEACGYLARDGRTFAVTGRGLRELAARAWFTDLPGDERIT